MNRFIPFLLLFILSGCGDATRPQVQSTPSSPPQAGPPVTVRTAEQNTKPIPPPPPDDISPSETRDRSVVLPTSPPSGAPTGATSKSDSLPLEDAIQQFVDSKIIGKTYFRNDVARVRVTKKFIDGDIEGQNFVLRAIWSYYYEDKPSKTKLFVVDDATFKEIGFFDDATGYHANKPSVAMENHGAKVANSSDHNGGYSSGGQTDGYGFSGFGAGGTRSSTSSGGIKDVYVSGYTRKNGTYVHPYMRSSPRR